MNILKITLIVTLLGLSCKKRNVHGLVEKGCLLWVDGLMGDSLIKKAVHETIINSTLIVAQVPWEVNSKSHLDNIFWYAALASDHGKSLMINLDWQLNDRSGVRGNWKFSDKETSKQFRKNVLDIVRKYKPKYLTLGVEVNYYAVTEPNDYGAFIRQFNLLKDQIKLVNPSTRVGLSFQLDLLYGNHKSWHPNNSIQTLEAIVENLDFIGLSSYPKYSTLDELELPSRLSYIDSIGNTFKVPYGIIETGIANEDSTNRIGFFKDLKEISQTNSLEFLIYGSMIDNANHNGWENKIGLLSSNGESKYGYNIWSSIKTTIK